MSVFKRNALIYFEHFGFNVLPLRGKKPIIIWDKWQSEKQTIEDIEKMDWSTSTGVGTVLGLDDLRVLDLDGVEDYEILDMLLTELELPNKYRWVIQSGSGEGFHIYIKCGPTPAPESSSEQALPETKGVFEKLGGEKAVYKLQMKPVSQSASRGEDEKYCKHIELRWKNCQNVLPPSRHESGGIYNFYFDEPNEMPVYVDAEKLITVLEKYCVMNYEKSEVRNQKSEEIKKDEKITYDKERLESALNYLSQNLPSNSYDDWYRIGFALSTLGEVGEKYFIEMSLNNPNYNDSESEIKKKFAELNKDNNGRITLGTIYHLAELYGWKKPSIIFWIIDDNGRLKISRTRYKRFLESEGFCKYKIDPTGGTSSNYLFVKIENNIVEEIDCIDVKEFLMNYLSKLPIEEFNGTNRTEVIDILIKSANQLFTTQFLEFLITREIQFNRDTMDKSYVYFKNCFVEVSKAGIKFNDYKKLEKHIWRKQIIDRDFVYVEKRSMFEDFLFNICRNNLQRFEALKSAIGFLLHGYKDPSIAKAIVFIDEKLSEGASGRSGKGVVIRAVSNIRNVVIEDGRNFNPSKNFAFQRIKADTNIIAFEDLSARFPFEKLFSIITDGITIEKKNKDEIFFKFSESPKVVVSTNFTIKGIDDSTLDRQFIIEFSDYYSLKHKPVNDFGKLFFDGWNKDEWNEYDCFMIECLQFYLKRGLVYYEFVNIEKKKLIDETSAEFVEFIEGIEINKEYDKKNLFEDFKKEYSEFDSVGAGKLTQGKFTRWLKVYGRIKGYDVAEGKSGAKRTVEFRGEGEKNAA